MPALRDCGPHTTSKRRSSLLTGALLLSFSSLAAQTQVASTTKQPCVDLPHADHPKTELRSGAMSAVVFLPDAQTGYYRGSRFDWSGIVGCLQQDGHTFFGEWFSKYDPEISDAVTGPAEEFRHPTSELGYDDAAPPVDGKPGGTFLKIGVGTLRRLDDRPYSFGRSYPVVDHGTWTVKIGKDFVTFRQVLQTDVGYGYVYEKTLRLNGRGHVLTLTHSLRNTGSKPLDTAVYNHDFFMLDGLSTGPGMELRLPFTPIPDKPLPESATIDGTTIRITAPLQPRQGLGAYITGFSPDQVSDFDFTFEDKPHNLSVRETADTPLTKMYLWATPKTFCPEGYIAIHVQPGAEQHWTLRYTFTTP